MCKCKRIEEYAPPTQTNLSLSITGVDDFAEGSATQYTASLTLSGVIGSPNTVLTVTLPAGITYVSSSDSGSESSGVITWTLGDLIANKSVTFTINSDTPAPEYTLTGQVLSDFGNLGTATASKEIEVTEAPALGIEIRGNFVGEEGSPTTGINSINLCVVNAVDYTADFTIDFADLGGGLCRLGYFADTVPTGTFAFRWNDDFGLRIAQAISYTKANPTTIDYE